MAPRPVILVSMVIGMIWGVVVLWLGQTWLAGAVQNVSVWEALAMTGLMVGFVVIAMIGRLAQRRFFDHTIIDGDAFAPGSAADIDQRVLTNTVEQVVLAVLIWPLAGIIHGSGVVVALGISFAIARLFFWIGYHISPPLRGVGFAATFYPTVLVALWTLWVWAM